MSARETELEEERLRDAVRALSDDQRRRFYDIATPRLRDPDTYAALFSEALRWPAAFLLLDGAGAEGTGGMNPAPLGKT